MRWVFFYIEDFIPNDLKIMIIQTCFEQANSKKKTKFDLHRPHMEAMINVLGNKCELTLTVTIVRIFPFGEKT